VEAKHDNPKELMERIKETERELTDAMEACEDQDVRKRFEQVVEKADQRRAKLAREIRFMK